MWLCVYGRFGEGGCRVISLSHHPFSNPQPHLCVVCSACISPPPLPIAVRKGAFEAGQNANFSGKVLYRQCRKPVYTPSDWDPRLADRSAELPNARLVLDFVYGYQGTCVAPLCTTAPPPHTPPAYSAPPLPPPTIPPPRQGQHRPEPVLHLGEQGGLLHSGGGCGVPEPPGTSPVLLPRSQVSDGGGGEVTELPGTSPVLLPRSQVSDGGGSGGGRSLSYIFILFVIFYIVYRISRRLRDLHSSLGHSVDPSHRSHCAPNPFPWPQ